jgi:hypothetical protein
VIAIHALVYLPRVLRDGLADWRPSARRLAGAAMRRSVVVAALTAGLIVGLATYSAQSGWLAQRHHHEHALSDADRD